MIFEIISFIPFSYITSILYYIFCEINNDKNNNLKKMFGWAQTNYLLFFILSLMIFLLSLRYCIKVIKFFCWITTLIISAYLMYLIW